MFLAIGAGERIEEKRLKYLLELLSARSKAFTIAGGLLNQAPWCRFIFPELSGYSLINRMNEQISAVIEVIYINCNYQLVIMAN